ncbi:MAG: very short patch repair endonuclease [Pseudomonadota bacterium]
MDKFDAAKRSEIMSRIGGKNTKPEIRIRSVLHRAGFRFSLHSSRLPGKPDIVLPKYKTVVFFNGCFWHGHDCKRGALPKSNAEFWEEKITRTKLRDQKNDCELRDLGWSVFRIWQCRFDEDLSVTLDHLEQLRSFYCSIESKR